MMKIHKKIRKFLEKNLDKICVKYTIQSVKKHEDLMKIRKKSGNQIIFRQRKPKYHILEVYHPFCEEIWRFNENPEKIRKIDRYLENKIIMSYYRSELSILWRNVKIWWKSGENLGKIWEKSGNRITFQKQNNHIIWEK